MNFAKEVIGDAMLVQEYFEKFLLDFHQDQAEKGCRISPYRSSVKNLSDAELELFSKDIVTSFRLNLLIEYNLESNDLEGYDELESITSALKNKIFEYLKQYRAENIVLGYHVTRIMDKIADLLINKKEA